MGILRLILALSVVAMHYGAIFGQKLVGGQIAVQSFYIISGFYMSLILNEKYVGANSSYSLFISNRFYRLYPIYWAVLIATLIFMGVSAVATGGEKMYAFKSYLNVVPSEAAYAFLILSNLLMFGQDAVMFMGINPESGALFFTPDFALTDPQLHTYLFVPQAWTLGIELSFYLIAPFILRRGAGIVIVLMLLSIGSRLVTYYGFGFTNDPWTYRFFPSELLFFLCGYLSYRLFVRLRKSAVPDWIPVSTLVLLLALTFSYQYIELHSDFDMPFKPKQIVYLLLIALSVPFLFRYFKSNKADNHIGELSYPVYISHILVGIVCWNQPVAFLKTGWGIAGATLLFSWMLNRFIADPVEKFRQSRLKANDTVYDNSGNSEIKTAGASS